MKKYNSFLKFLLIAFTALFITSCVHDDKYDDPNLDTFQCQDLTANITIAQVKALHPMLPNANDNKRYVFPADSPAILEGYVSSTDETGNIYKTIFIQDDPVNPTQGFVISVDAVSTYTKFPQGSKIYIKLKGMALGTYGNLIQLGIEDERAIATGQDAVSRIPEKQVPSVIFRSCTVRENIIPKVLTLQQMSSNENLLGALIQVNDAEFDSRLLCSTYAPNGATVDRQINDPTLSTATRVIRNSGFASFSNQTLPSGKGKLIGIFSKFTTTYQLYINKAEDLADMNHFPRKDGIAKDPCGFDQEGLTQKTVAEVKQLLNGSITSITADLFIKAKVTANDEANNFQRQIYVEDATGGIKININKASLFQDERFRVGKEIYIKLKDLSIGIMGGEVQLGIPSTNPLIFGQIPENQVYKYFFDSKVGITPITSTERTINQLTAADVGKWIKIKNLQFIDADKVKNYAFKDFETRTLEDCSGNKLTLRTHYQASFAGNDVDEGKGDLYAIITLANGQYQAMIPYQRNADFDGLRCDGSVPSVYNTIFAEPFDTLENWNAISVTGARVWGIANFGNPRPSAMMDGNRSPNEDWLILKNPVSLSGYKDAFFTFETDGRYEGAPLEVYVTENYTGTTTNWTKLNAGLDTDLSNFNGFVGSGRVSLKDYLNKNVTIAFKYTSVSGFSTTWEVDNFTVKGAK